MADKKRKVIFKRPGDSLTIGGQTFNAGNITAEIYDALKAINAGYAEYFEVVETEYDKSVSEEAKPAKAAPTK